jgi:hypothetical protein
VSLGDTPESRGVETGQTIMVHFSLRSVDTSVSICKAWRVGDVHNAMKWAFQLRAGVKVCECLYRAGCAVAAGGGGASGPMFCDAGHTALALLLDLPAVHGVTAR